jgi:hypothetical protein
MLLENDGKGTLQTILWQWQPNDVGMVTDAVWEDIDNDSKKIY